MTTELYSIIRKAAETRDDVHIEEDGVRVGDYFFWFNRDEVKPEFFKGLWSEVETGTDEVIDASADDLLDALKALG